MFFGEFDIGTTFVRLCLLIDTIIYKAIGWMYAIFYTIASNRIFSSEVVTQFLNRIYLIIGVVMLFIVAYSFLNVIINPDNLSKGKTTPSKIVFNVVLSLISIVFIPTVFNFGYSLQNAVMEENVIGKLILGVSNVDNLDNVAGGSLALNIFQSSFYLTDNATEEVALEYNEYSMSAAANNDISYFQNFLTDDVNYIDEGYIHYNYIICGVIGIYVLYCLLTFCFDIGLRAVKLLFLEIIAPLPALLLIVPGQDKVFKTWAKESLSTFLMLFLRVLVIFFGIFLINAVDSAFENGTFLNIESSSTGVASFAKLFVILGILMFIHQVPKLLGDIFGFKTEGGLFNLGRRLNESGVNSFFGMVGGAIAGYRGGVRGAQARGVEGRRAQAMEGVRSLFNGARNGRGGLQNMGKAYDYALAAQKVRARGGNQVAIWGNALRNEFGFGSYYDYQLKYKEIEHDRNVSSDRRDLDSFKAAGNTAIRKHNEQFQPKIEALKTDKDAMESLKSSAETFIKKSDQKNAKFMATIELPEFDSEGNLKLQTTGSGQPGHLVTSTRTLNSYSLDKMKEQLIDLHTRGQLSDDNYNKYMSDISQKQKDITDNFYKELASHKSVESALRADLPAEAMAKLLEINKDIENNTFSKDLNNKAYTGNVISDGASFKAAMDHVKETLTTAQHEEQYDLLNRKIVVNGQEYSLQRYNEIVSDYERRIKSEDEALSDAKIAYGWDRETHEEMRKLGAPGGGFFHRARGNNNRNGH